MNKLAASIAKFLSGPRLLIAVLLTLSQMAWLADHGQDLRDKDISPNGILDLQFVNAENSEKLLATWKADSAYEKIPITIQKIVGKPAKMPLTTIALHDIFLDFPFIFCYALVVFALISYALDRWELHHLEAFLGIFFSRALPWLKFISGKKLTIALLISLLIAVLDVVENFCMINIIYKIPYVPEVLARPFAASKFGILICTAIFVLFTFLYFLILRILTSPAKIIESLNGLFNRINNP